MAPIPGARVQFCSDSLCRMGKTDENGLASFHSDPGTYTVHFMKAPEGYVNSTEEFTLDKDNREATYLLDKQEAGSGSASDSDHAGSADPDPETDFPLTGFTFTAPGKFKEVSGEIQEVDYGEFEPGSGITIDMSAIRPGPQLSTRSI